VLHSIQNGFKVKMDSRFRLSSVFVSQQKTIETGGSAILFLAGEAEAGAGGDRPAKE
jgi:hypothetical protein